MNYRIRGDKQTLTIRPSHWANDDGTAFKNPWTSSNKPTWRELMDCKFPLGWYANYEKKHQDVRDVKVVVPDWGLSSLEKQGLTRDECIIGTALGHAGIVTELKLEATGSRGGGKESFWVVYDPIFSSRAGPTPYTGVEREKPPPCQVGDLLGCDAVMLSHNHYDHLDLPTLQALSSRFPGAIYFVPLGHKDWLCSIGITVDKVFELDWWQETSIEVGSLGYTVSQDATENTVLRFTCVPAQHNSGRGALDQGSTLWCGWVIEQLLSPKEQLASSTTRRKGAIYHAGDTGYRRTAKSEAVCPIFKEIGEKLGPFDLSFIPIWRGGSLGFISYLGLRLDHNHIPSALHASPMDAIDIHKDVRSRNTIAIHFGTFVGSEDESKESIMEFEEGRESRNVLELREVDEQNCGRTGVVDIGASFAVKISARDVCNSLIDRSDRS